MGRSMMVLRLRNNLHDGLAHRLENTEEDRYL